MPTISQYLAKQILDWSLQQESNTQQQSETGLTPRLRQVDIIAQGLAAPSKITPDNVAAIMKENSEITRRFAAIEPLDKKE